MSVESVVEFWSKIDSDNKLQEKFFSTVKSPEGAQVVEFARAQGFDFNADELNEVAERSQKEELSDADLENVAGGAGAPRMLSFGRTSMHSLAKLNQFKGARMIPDVAL